MDEISVETVREMFDYDLYQIIRDNYNESNKEYLQKQFDITKSYMIEEQRKEVKAKGWIVKKYSKGWNECIDLICPYCGIKLKQVEWPEYYNYCPRCGKELACGEDEVRRVGCCIFE